MGRVNFVTMTSLNRALSTVIDDLDWAGIWDDLEPVDVMLVPSTLDDVINILPWKWGDSSWGCYDGNIYIPAVTVSRLASYFNGHPNASLTDTLRHEYGHALVESHRGLFRSRRFRDLFGASIDDDTEFEYDPDFHVSGYAATNVEEEFCENFMFYLKHHGRPPRHMRKPYMKDVWRFIRDVCRAVEHGKRKW